MELQEELSQFHQINSEKEIFLLKPGNLVFSEKPVKVLAGNRKDSISYYWEYKIDFSKGLLFLEFCFGPNESSYFGYYEYMKFLMPEDNKIMVTPVGHVLHTFGLLNNTFGFLNNNSKIPKEKLFYFGS